MQSPKSKWTETEVFGNIYVIFAIPVDTKNPKWSPDL